MVADICVCGAVATEILRMHTRRPRETFEPLAVDPWYVHGFHPLRTCGETACEASSWMAFLAENPDTDTHLGDDFEISYLVDDDPGDAA